MFGKKNYLQLQMAAFSHVGRVRTKNQDNMYFLGRYLEESNQSNIKILRCKDCNTKKPILLGVFDGMGGYALGEKASYITARETEMAVRQKLPSDTDKITQIMKNICFHANEKVCKEIEKVNARIGTTASMLCFSNRNVCVCNIGDSPIFRIRNHEIEAIHMEHTERLLKERLYGTEKVKGKKFLLTQHIGIMSEEMMIEPYTDVMEISPGDYYLICSDGLTDMVEEVDICEMIEEADSPSDAIQKLVSSAIRAGGKDNITMIIIQVKSNNKYKI